MKWSVYLIIVRMIYDIIIATPCVTGSEVHDTVTATYRLELLRVTQATSVTCG